MTEAADSNDEQQLAQKECQWRIVLEDYPGTEYARIAQVQLEQLKTLRAAMQQARNTSR